MSAVTSALKIQLPTMMTSLLSAIDPVNQTSLLCTLSSALKNMIFDFFMKGFLAQSTKSFGFNFRFKWLTYGPENFARH